MCVRFLFVIFQLLEFGISESITEDTGCEHKDNYLYCTTIPKDLPKNVTRVYLNYGNNQTNIKTHEIQEGDFDGKYWEDLKFFQINNSIGIQDYAMMNLTNLEELIIIGDIFRSLESDSFAGLNNLKVLRLNALKPLSMIDVTNALKNTLPNLEVLSLADMALSDMTYGLQLRSKTERNIVYKKYDHQCKCMAIGRRCRCLKQGYVFARSIEEFPVNILNCDSLLRPVIDLVSVMASKPLKSLDMYGIIMDDIAFALIPLAMKHYDKINITFSKFHNLDFILYKEYYTNSLMDKPEDFVTCLDNLVSDIKTDVSVRRNNTLHTVSVFDASYVSSPGIKEYITYVLTLRNTSHTIAQDLIPALSTAEIINITGINGCHRKIAFKNLTVNITSHSGTSSPTRELILRNNDLNYLDVKFKCNESNLEILDLSSNDIEFLQPEMCPCCLVLKEINLAKNQLFKMADTHLILFGRLFSLYPNLTKVFLQLNQLTTIPKELFNENKNLELIDLSNNFLTNVNFTLNHLVNLKTLDLKNNKISVLDATSFANLKLVLQNNKTLHNNSRIIAINDNPILCSECEHLSSIKWIATTSLIYHDGNKMICKNHDGNYIPADQNAVNQLQEECDKPKRIRRIIILSTVIPLTTTALAVISSYIWLQYRRQMLRRKNMQEKIELIKQNQLETRYVVFLSYSSEDTNFLNKYVYNPLKIHLQEKVKTERELICLGDKHFQLGKPLNDEMVRTLQQSAVMLLLVSRNFCNSEFCRMEFDHALFMKKPFILMVKGEIDVNEMVPSLQEIYNRNTRLLWEREGDIFEMKTSWDNVCSSILDLVP